MILAPSGVEPLSDNKRITKITAQLTEMSVPKAEAFNLMGEDNSVEETSSEKVLHWKKRVIWSVMSEDIALNAQELPPEIFPYIKNRIDQETRSYLPIVMVDHLSSRLSDLEVSITYSRKVVFRCVKCYSMFFSVNYLIIA